MKLYVGNLNFRVTEEDLRELFSPFGPIDDLILLHDRETGRSRGFGFVTLADDQLAQKAIDDLHQQDYQGRDLVLNEAQPRTPGNPGTPGSSGSRHASGKAKHPRHHHPRGESSSRSVGGGYVGKPAAETTAPTPTEEKSPPAPAPAPEADPPVGGGYRRGNHN